MAKGEGKENWSGYQFALRLSHHRAWLTFAWGEFHWKKYQLLNILTILHAIKIPFQDMMTSKNELEFTFVKNQQI